MPDYEKIAYGIADGVATVLDALGLSTLAIEADRQQIHGGSFDYAAAAVEPRAARDPDPSYSRSLQVLSRREAAFSGTMMRWIR